MMVSRRARSRGVEDLDGRCFDAKLRASTIKSDDHFGVGHVLKRGQATTQLQASLGWPPPVQIKQLFPSMDDIVPVHKKNGNALRGHAWGPRGNWNQISSEGDSLSVASVATALGTASASGSASKASASGAASKASASGAASRASASGGASRASASGAASRASASGAASRASTSGAASRASTSGAASKETASTISEFSRSRKVPWRSFWWRVTFWRPAPS